MLDPWIINEILRREEQRQETGLQPLVIEAPSIADHMPDAASWPSPPSKDGTIERGVVIIEL